VGREGRREGGKAERRKGGKGGKAIRREGENSGAGPAVSAARAGQEEETRMSRMSRIREEQ
jgi:hypothetical protein